MEYLIKNNDAKTKVIRSRREKGPDMANFVRISRLNRATGNFIADPSGLITRKVQLHSGYIMDNITYITSDHFPSVTNLEIFIAKR